MKLMSKCLVAMFAVLHVPTPALALTSFTRAKASAVTSVADSQLDAGRKHDHIATDEDPGISNEPTAAAAEPEGFLQGGASAAALASASAEIGHLGLSVVGLANGVGTHTVMKNGSPVLQAGAKAEAIGHAEAEWVDVVTLSSPGGLVARAEFNVFLEGDLGAHSTGNGFGSVDFLLFNGKDSRLILPDSPAAPGQNPPSNLWGDAIDSASGNIHNLNQIPGGFRVEVFPPTNGTFPIGFSIKLDGFAFAGETLVVPEGSGFGNASFFGDVSRSLRWGGVEAVYNLNGQKIDDWTITSESGFDYSQPFPAVPEPSSPLLFAMALCAWFAGRGAFLIGR